jgi:hypothetical protein
VIRVEAGIEIMFSSFYDEHCFSVLFFVNSYVRRTFDFLVATISSPLPGNLAGITLLIKTPCSLAHVVNASCFGSRAMLGEVLVSHEMLACVRRVQVIEVKQVDENVHTESNIWLGVHMMMFGKF